MDGPTDGLRLTDQEAVNMSYRVTFCIKFVRTKVSEGRDEDIIVERLVIIVSGLFTADF